MNYVSTRGVTRPYTFEEVLLSGLAPDGGLFVPQSWPEIDARSVKPQSRYADAAFSILSRFTGQSFSDDELRADIDDAYADFDDPFVTPTSRLSDNLYLLELFHGPTLAFKDIAMQLLGRLLSRTLARRKEYATVVVATSGDTGSAAIAALGGLAGITLFVLHPKGRVSEVQRRQMTTARHANVYNIALEGTFDDTQRVVKSLFSDTAFSSRMRLVAVNSINFVRIAAQCVYYFTAGARFDRPAVFIVPTGNFGDVFAGEVAMRMGLPVEKLIVATNANDILWRALELGIYSAGPVRQTLSPSMDIQVASNFERALFEASGRNSQWICEAMAGFAQQGTLRIPPECLEELRSRYLAFRVSDRETLETMARVHREIGRIIDPHTAVGVHAAAQFGPSKGQPLVVLATAHPAKFPDSVARATGSSSPLPPRLAALYEEEERCVALPNEPKAVRNYIQQQSGVA